MIPYFERFMIRFPSIPALANASADEVMHQWTGLGYYARARNLHKTAQLVMSDYDGKLPIDPERLEALPGIGRSTANAIVAQCANRRAVILDGNVKRVLSRYFAVDGWPGQSSTLKTLWTRADELTPENRAADYTQAIMDLGALVCTRTRPACDACPVSTNCVALAQDTIDLYPNRKPRKALPTKTTAMLYIEAEGKVLLEKRSGKGVWAGLWSLPESDPDSVDATLSTLGIFEPELIRMKPFRHSFTHYHLDIIPYYIRCVSTGTLVGETNQMIWQDPSSPSEVGMSRPTVLLIERIGHL